MHNLKQYEKVALLTVNDAQYVISSPRHLVTLQRLIASGKHEVMITNYFKKWGTMESMGDSEELDVVKTGIENIISMLNKE